MKLSDALAGGGGFAPPMLFCRITKVYERKSGEKNGKQWSLQGAILLDDSTEASAVFWDMPDLRDLGGAAITIQARKNGKGRLSGITVKAEEYKGKKQLKINIDNQAEISRGKIAHPEQAAESEPYTGGRKKQAIVKPRMSVPEFMQHVGLAVKMAKEASDMLGVTNGDGAANILGVIMRDAQARGMRLVEESSGGSDLEEESENL